MEWEESRTMPDAIRKPCSNPGGCSALVPFGRCEAHAQQTGRAFDSRRGSSTRRGYDYRHQRERETFLKRNPICVHCKADGHVEPATELDHIIPHKGNQKLLRDQSNWQGLCKSCHSRKTNAEKGKTG